MDRLASRTWTPAPERDRLANGGSLDPPCPHPAEPVRGILPALRPGERPHRKLVALGRPDDDGDQRGRRGRLALKASRQVPPDCLLGGADTVVLLGADRLSERSHRWTGDVLALGGNDGKKL